MKKYDISNIDLKYCKGLGVCLSEYLMISDLQISRLSQTIRSQTQIFSDCQMISQLVQ